MIASRMERAQDFFFASSAASFAWDASLAWEAVLAQLPSIRLVSAMDATAERAGASFMEGMKMG